MKDWILWLWKSLKDRGFVVKAPAMPEPDEPTIENWVHFLKTFVGEADEDTYFVGHSIGCQTILRYLETLPEGTRVGGSRTVIESGKGHFDEKSGVIKLQRILSEITRISSL